jgi:hypothetical protein
MAVTPAEKQRRYRERLSEREQDPRDTIEAELLQEVERAERDELTAEACAALANKLADMAPSLARAGARKAGAEGAPSGLESSGRSRPIVTPSCASRRQARAMDIPWKTGCGRGGSAGGPRKNREHYYRDRHD